MAFTLLFAVLLFMILGSNPEYIPVVVGIFILYISIFVWGAMRMSDEEKRNIEIKQKIKEEKRRQTVDEYNEMAITSLYSHMASDENKKPK